MTADDRALLRRFVTLALYGAAGTAMVAAALWTIGRLAAHFDNLHPVDLIASAVLIVGGLIILITTTKDR